MDIQGKSYAITEIKCDAVRHDTVVRGKKANVARDDKEYFKNTKAKTVWIPKTVTKIETGAFSYFTKLKKIVVDKANPQFFSTRKGVFQMRQAEENQRKQFLRVRKICFFRHEGEGDRRVRDDAFPDIIVFGLDGHV